MRAPQTILIALALVGGVLTAAPASPFAVEVVRAHGPFDAAPYNDPLAVLGAPATWFYDPWAALSGGATNRRVKLVEAAYNIAAATNGLLTPNLLVTLGGGSEIIARFDQRIYDDPAHPYGVDLLVFGNAFYPANGNANDGANLNTLRLSGTTFFEPTKVSVSPGYTGQPGEATDNPDTWPWYRYDNGPYADTAFPTHAYRWNRATTNWSDTLMDFTKPVNPAMQTVLAAGGLSAADAVDLYDGSGGGTGFDLSASGFPWIQYVKVEGVDPHFSYGEIDAFASVRSMTLGDTLSVAPGNLLSNPAALPFQQPGAATSNLVTLSFTALSDVAQVATAALTNWSALAPLPGAARTAVQLELTPILGSNLVTFTTDLALATGTNYSGNGNDLLVLQARGTNWNFCAFTFSAATRQVTVTGITNLSAFVVVQFVAPTLQLTASGGHCSVRFAPVAGLVHELERSTNLITWAALNSFTASNTAPVTITDNAAPTAKAFYRVKVSQP